MKFSSHYFALNNVAEDIFRTRDYEKFRVPVCEILSTQKLCIILSLHRMEMLFKSFAYKNILIYACLMMLLSKIYFIF